jgi:Holliday junction DNA helicase RuvB
MDAFDITVPETNNFILGNGIVVHNSAKTLIIEELSRLPNSKFVLGSSLTKAGLSEILFAEKPKYLLIDELDKIDSADNLSVLLSLMERGLITETKYRRHRLLRLKTWVFASANDINKLPPELLSRFLLLRFRDYTPAEYTDVVVKVLKEREGIPENIALYIADRVLRVLNSRDVRDSIKIARLISSNPSKEEVDKIVELIRRQK